MKTFTDMFAKWRGGYGFIISLTVFLIVWIGLNKLPWFPHWDDPDMFLLNLILSIEASFAMPVLLMSQAQQGQEDRAIMNADFAANLVSKDEIQSLQRFIKGIEVEKLDAIHERAVDLDAKLDLILNRLTRLEKVVPAGGIEPPTSLL
jgi:uncharacterized membrane protein